jgi:hypothetical protein
MPISPGARPVDDSNWQVVDHRGEVVGIIWRVGTWPPRFRCASRKARGITGIEHSDFDTVLGYALEHFAQG